MKVFHCKCNNTIFFENSECVACSAELGWCPACQNLVALLPSEAGHFRCANSECRVLLAKCKNYAIEKVCNRCCRVPEDLKTTPEFCGYCRFNDTIPDLTVPGNREMWQRLESAKRRLLYTLDLMRLPYGTKADGFEPPLAFDFKADLLKKPQFWWSTGKEERVYTGHADGKITINLREADTVEREKTRVLFQEAHRTVIGHFRHEIAHYYWEMLVKPKSIPEFKAVFGDHENPSYADAQQRYYKEGPIADWQANYISGYASMHPWEDFAETFATYLDMVSVLDTAGNMEVQCGCDPTHADLQTMVEQYVNLGVKLNEMNRAMGLLDYVPEIFVPPVVTKLHYVFDLVRAAALPNPSLAVDKAPAAEADKAV